MRNRILMALLALGLFSASHSFADTWSVDPVHSNVIFSVKHLMVSTVKGTFDKFEGQAVAADSTLEDLQLEATIDASSINTRNTDRDNHLRSADFFDAANYPAITFKSKRAERVAPGKLKLTGDLTIRGVTKEVVLDVEGFDRFVKDMQGNLRTAATATTTINRRDFGLNWNKALETGGVVVSDEVDITIDAALVRKQTS